MPRDADRSKLPQIQRPVCLPLLGVHLIHRFLSPLSWLRDYPKECLVSTFAATDGIGSFPAVPCRGARNVPCALANALARGRRFVGIAGRLETASLPNFSGLYS